MVDSLLDDSSFLVALSFLFFCLLVWFWKGKTLSQAMREYVELRLSPLRQAEAQYVELEERWLRARRLNEQLPQEIEEIKNSYIKRQQEKLLAIKKEEEAWHKAKQAELKERQRILKRLAEKEELEKILQEFVEDPAKK